MEQHLSLVTLGVADLARSRRFDEKGLGWRASRASTGEVVFFQLGGITLALWGREALAVDARLPGPGPDGGVALAHNVRTREEVDARSWPAPARRAAAS
jgi:catechol 2,3-dioxygenase-like lactoylglutathione lyase family enzyme